MKKLRNEPHHTHADDHLSRSEPPHDSEKPDEKHETRMAHANNEDTAHTSHY